LCCGNVWAEEKTHWRLEVSVEDAAQKIQHAILRQTFPAQAAQVIFAAYEQIMGNRYLAIKPSWVLETNHEGKDALAVKGEANLLESLLRVWADFYQTENLQSLHQHWKTQKIPAALFVQEMIESDSTAIVYTYTHAAPESDFFVRSSWGVAPDLHFPETPADSFALDSNHLSIVVSQLQPKPTKVTYQLDRLQELPVARDQQFAPSLGFNQLREVVKLSKILAQHYKTAQKIEWAVKQNQFWLLRARPFSEKEQEVLLKKFAGKAAETASKLEVEPGLPVFTLATGTPAPENNLKQVVDTGLIYQQLHLHPYKLIHQRRGFLLQNNLQKYIPEQLQAQVLFRLCNLTATQLRQLNSGKEYEELENNPALGYRGALRLLHTHSLLDLELSAVAELAKHHPQRLGMILPMVRTASELLLLNRHITQKNWYQSHPLPIWCEISTPAALNDWAEFKHIPIAGIVLNFELLHALMYGIDPDHTDILRLYPTQLGLLQSAITQLRQTAPQLQIVVQVSEASCEVMECLTQLNVAGVIVREGRPIKR
jgi:phosphoenolpyruvate synthase/pyruvate phosphate dikinase